MRDKILFGAVIILLLLIIVSCKEETKGTLGVCEPCGGTYDCQEGLSCRNKVSGNICSNPQYCVCASSVSEAQSCGGSSIETCPDGRITSTCICRGSERSSGVCCDDGNEYQSNPDLICCADGWIVSSEDQCDSGVSECNEGDTVLCIGGGYRECQADGTWSDCIVEETCTDSDGNNYKTRGYVEYNSQTLYDDCTADGTLMEWICTSGESDWDEVDCADTYGSSWKCQEGKCIEQGCDPNDVYDYYCSGNKLTNECGGLVEDCSSSNKDCKYDSGYYQCVSQPTPPPPPPPDCDKDGICESGETPQNCPNDCREVQCQQTSECPEKTGFTVTCVGNKCVYKAIPPNCKAYEEFRDNKCVFSLKNLFSIEGLKQFFKDYNWQVILAFVLLISIIGVLIYIIVKSSKRR